MADSSADAAPEWTAHNKHLFVLTSAGKPVFSRHGSDSLLPSLTSVIQAIASRASEGGDPIRSMTCGGSRFVFLLESGLTLLTVAHSGETEHALREQLRAQYGQILFALTVKILDRLAANPGTDIRAFLAGTRYPCLNLIRLGNRMPTWLDAIPCLPMSAALRAKATSLLAGTAAASPGMVYAILLAGYTAVAWAQSRSAEYALRPFDLMLLTNTVQCTASFRTTDSWTPVCLPQMNATGYLHAFVSMLAEADDGGRRASSTGGGAGGVRRASAVGKGHTQTPLQPLERGSSQEFTDDDEDGEEDHVPVGGSVKPHVVAGIVQKPSSSSSAAAAAAQPKPSQPPSFSASTPASTAASIPALKQQAPSALPPMHPPTNGVFVPALGGVGGVSESKDQHHRAHSDGGSNAGSNSARVRLDADPPAVFLVLVSSQTSTEAIEALTRRRAALGASLQEAGVTPAAVRAISPLPSTAFTAAAAAGGGPRPLSVGDFTLESTGVPGLLHCVFVWKPQRQYVQSRLPAHLHSHRHSKCLLRAYQHVYDKLLLLDAPQQRHYVAAYPGFSEIIGAVAGIHTTSAIVMAAFSGAVPADAIPTHMEKLAKLLKKDRGDLLVGAPGVLLA